MSKWTTTDIPDQTGRTAVVTGSNTGLGFETAAALAANGAHVVLAVRNIDKGNDAAARIGDRTPGASVAVQELDLTSLDSVRGRRRTASVQARHHRPADQQRGCDDDAEVDDQGRLRIAVRHKPFGPLRVHRSVARSRARRPGLARRHGQQRRTPLRAQRHSLRRPAVGKDYGRVAAYGQAKLANLMFTYELQRRLQGTNTIAAAAHPGGSGPS